VRRYTPSPFSGRICQFLPNKEWLRPDNARQRWRYPWGLRWRSLAQHSEEYFGPDSVDPDRMLIDPDAPVFAELFRQCRDRYAVGCSVSADTDAAQYGFKPSSPLRTRA
jgi:hypothetical protein